MGLDLVDVSRRGIAEGKDRPELSLYGWAMSALDSEGRDWDESAVHVSDYKVILDPGDKQCDRQLWHRFNGDSKQDGSLWRDVMFDQGNAMHTRFSYYISLGLPDPWEVYGIEVSCEDYLPHDDDVGSADLVLWNPEREHFFVIEIKSQRGRGIQRIKSEGEPKDSHKLQCQGYLYALRRRFLSEYNNCTMEGAVFYLDREGQNPPVPFPVDPDDELIEKASALANQIKGQFGPPKMMEAGIKISRNKTTADSVYLDIPWQCEYCDFRDFSCPSMVEPSVRLENKVGELHEREVDLGTGLDYRFKPTKDLTDAEILKLRGFVQDCLRNGRYSDK